VVRALVRLFLLLVLVAVLLVAWVGVRGWLAKDHLENSADLVQRLQLQVERGQTAPARTTLRNLQSETASAGSLTGDVVWRGFSHLPGIGDDMRAVHIVAVAGHNLTIDALPPLAAAATDVSQLRNAATSGLSPRQVAAAAQRLKTPLAGAKTGIDQARSQIATVDPAGLLGPVRSGVQQFKTGLDQLSAALTTLITADDAAVNAAGALTG
jgi:hypothetical protein